MQDHKELQRRRLKPAGWVMVLICAPTSHPAAALQVAGQPQLIAHGQILHPIRDAIANLIKIKEEEMMPVHGQVILQWALLYVCPVYAPQLLHLHLWL